MKEKPRTIIIPDLFIVIKLLEEKPKSVTDIQYEANLNYSHIHQLKKGMIEHNLVNITKENKKMLMALNEDGLKLLNIVNNYLDFFNIKKENMTNLRRTKYKEITPEAIKNDSF